MGSCVDVFRLVPFPMPSSCVGMSMVGCVVGVALDGGVGVGIGVVVVFGFEVCISVVRVVGGVFG